MPAVITDLQVFRSMTAIVTVKFAGVISSVIAPYQRLHQYNIPKANFIYSLRFSTFQQLRQPFPVEILKIFLIVATIKKYCFFIYTALSLTKHLFNVSSSLVSTEKDIVTVLNEHQFIYSDRSCKIAYKVFLLAV